MGLGDGHDLASPRFAGDLVLEACFDGEHRMLPPESGPAVEEVQRALADLGHFHTYRDVDGVFGPRTAAVVHAFKVEHALEPSDGVVGPKTMGALDGLFPDRPLVAGNFTAFVAERRLGPEVGDLLDELDTFYPADSWAKQIAAFVHHELTNGNLIGIVRGTKANDILPLVPPPLQAQVAADVVTLDTTTASAVTQRVEINPGQFQGYTLFKDDVLDDMRPGRSRHFFGMLFLAHEMTHFRNRDFFVALERSPVAAHPELFVQPTLPGNSTFMASRFMEELACDHVAYRVKSDTDARFGHPAPALATGQLFRFALDLAPGTINDAYRTALGATFNQQIAVWMRALGSRLFHDDPARNAEVAGLLEAEFLAAQASGFATPGVESAGGE